MPAPAIITYDDRGAVLGWNTGASILSGYAEGELLGRPLSSVLESERSAETDARAFTGILITRSGKRLMVERTRGSIRSRDGAVVGYTELICQREAPPDEFIAPRPTPHEAFNGQGDSRFRQLAAALPQLVWCCDASGACNYVSARWVEYTGLPIEQLLGAGWIGCVHPDDRERCTNAWQKTSLSEQEYRIEARLRRHDGTYRWVDGRASPVRDEQGRVIGWVGCNTDIHDARTLRDVLERERDLLERWIATAPGVAFIYHLKPDGSSSFPRLGPAAEQLYVETAEELARDGSAACSTCCLKTWRS